MNCGKRCVAMGMIVGCLQAYAAAPDAGWPMRPVRVLVGYPAGGPTDSVARVLAEALGKEAGQQFVVENRAGADGAIAVNAGVRADADGYTLIVSLKGAMAVAPFVSRLPYEPLSDLTPLATLGQSPLLFATRPDSGLRRLGDLREVYKKRGGKLSIGYVGAFNQMMAVQLTQEAGVDLLLVPYKGGPAAVNDLIGGRIDMMVGDAAGPAVEQIKAGNAVGLAVTSSHRAAELPGVPTVAESGFPALQGVQWYGLWGPARMPAALVEKIHRLAAKAMGTPLSLERLGNVHIEPFAQSLEQMRALMVSESTHWRMVAEKAGIKPQ